MADKTWTATALELGKLTIHRVIDKEARPAIQLERRYKFLDADGEVLRQIAGGRVLETIPIADIPPSILSALQEIDQWTEQKALEQEGMT